MNLRKIVCIFWCLLLSLLAGAQQPSYAQFKQLNTRIGNLMPRGQADSMLVLSRRLLTIAQQLHSDSLLSETYVSFGNAFMLKSDFENGLTYFFKGLHLAQQGGKTAPVIRALIDVASLYEDMENYPEARKYLRQAITLLPRTANKAHFEVYLYGNLSLVDAMTGYFAGARQALQRSGAAYGEYIKTHPKDTYIEAYQLYLAAQIERTDSVYRKAAAYSAQHQVNYTLTKILNAYGRYLLEQNRLAQAGVVAGQSIRTSTRSGFSGDAIQAAALLSKVYDRRRLADSANLYYRLKDSLQQQVYDRQRLNRLQDLTFTEQIRQQEEAAEAAEAAVARRNNIQYAGIAILIISLAVLYLRLSRKAARRPALTEFLGVIALLIFFEFINLLLHPLLGRFTHESPLPMLLFMVLTAALLVPLHHRMEGLVKRKAGKKGH